MKVPLKRAVREAEAQVSHAYLLAATGGKNFNHCSGCPHPSRRDLRKIGIAGFTDRKLDFGVRGDEVVSGTRWNKRL